MRWVSFRSLPGVAGLSQPASLIGASLLGVALLGAAVTPVTAVGRAGNSWGQGVFPVRAFVAFTSPFGPRTRPGGISEPHYGLDIAAPLGSEIVSWWSGTVTALLNDGGCGIGVVIRSGDYEHLYCHLNGSVSAGTYRSGPLVLREGERVRAGQLIGHVGLTGRTTGPHLHWGLRYRDTWMDPALVLRAMAETRRQPTISRWAPNVGPSR